MVSWWCCSWITSLTSEPWSSNFFSSMSGPVLKKSLYGLMELFFVIRLRLFPRRNMNFLLIKFETKINRDLTERKTTWSNVNKIKNRLQLKL